MAQNTSKLNFNKIFYRCMILIVIGMLAVLAFVLFLSKNLPSLEQLENYDPDLVTRIYSSDGKVLNELFVQKRVFIEIDRIPEHMQLSLIHI